MRTAQVQADAADLQFMLSSGHRSSGVVPSIFAIDLAPPLEQRLSYVVSAAGGVMCATSIGQATVLGPVVRPVAVLVAEARYLAGPNEFAALAARCGARVLLLEENPNGSCVLAHVREAIEQRAGGGEPSSSGVRGPLGVTVQRVRSVA